MSYDDARRLSAATSGKPSTPPSPGSEKTLEMAESLHTYPPLLIDFLNNLRSPEVEDP